MSDQTINLLVVRDPKPFRRPWVGAASTPFGGMFYLPRGRAWTRKGAYRKAWKCAWLWHHIPDGEKIKTTMIVREGWDND
jgi:hypothetical protein